MVQHLLEGFGRPSDDGMGSGITCYHVNVRLSEDLRDIGSPRFGKVFTLLGCCALALALRFRHGIHDFYYVPSPPKRASLYRDWIVMAIVRPFFRRVIFHWHAVGLGEWLDETARPWERWISRRLLGGVHQSLVLSKFSEADAAWLAAKRIDVVPNGIPDPCPNYAQQLASERSGRWELIRSQVETGSELVTVRVLFLALCTRDKGVHSAVEGILLANRRLAASGKRLRFRLTVAGTFVDRAEKEDFDQISAVGRTDGTIQVAGFLDAAAKAESFRQADLFLFPTYYANEGQPLNLIEAMAWGLPVVTTRWRAIPEMFPEGQPGLIEPRSLEQVVGALMEVVREADPAVFRRNFEDRFRIQVHLDRLSTVLLAGL